MYVKGIELTKYGCFLFVSEHCMQPTVFRLHALSPDVFDIEELHLRIIATAEGSPDAHSICHC